MSKLSQVTLRLLGGFALEANLGRAIAISVRSRKARALLAYLAMKPDYRARREELATLFWGDNPDSVARHSLRQCLISLRQDLCLASEILDADREVIGLRTDLIAVDAREFLALARSHEPKDLARAAELWCGEFLPDLTLDIPEFDAWHRQEAHRLSAAAATVFETLCRTADAAGDRGQAVAIADRLVALEPDREDRQRLALTICARHQGRETALKRAQELTDLLRGDLGVSPDPATRALIEAIRRGDFETAIPARIIVEPDAPHEAEPVTTNTALVLTAAEAPSRRECPVTPFWRRQPFVAAGALTCLGFGVVALELASNWALPLPLADLHGSQNPVNARTQGVAAHDTRTEIAVLPFEADDLARPDDRAFARALTHTLIGYLTRFGYLRVISAQTSDSYRERSIDIAQIRNEFGARYAIAGHVQGSGADLKIDFQLVDTATRTNVWSDHVLRERGDPALGADTLGADEAARGIARVLAIQIDRLDTLRTRGKPNSELSQSELVARGYLVVQSGSMRDNIAAAMKLFDEALQRDPHYQPALLAVARMHIISAMNFVDFDVTSNLNEAERQLNEILIKSPNSVSAHYSLALLAKHRRQYAASLQSLQRCLELNPTFLPAQGQIGDILIRMGQPQQGLDQILKTIRAASPNDPTMGYWYLFAAEAELELGHDQAALEWALRANTVMPGSPITQAWLASIYASLGDRSNAAKSVTLLMKIAPARMQQFMKPPAQDSSRADGPRRPRIFDGLRLALGASFG
jgi:DNA-binding SARP family transcriptional activator/TolB-like protein